MALIPAKTAFTIVPYGGALDSRYPGGAIPPDATLPVRIAEIPEMIFVLGYPEDECLGYYLLDPAVQIDPSYVWWDTVGATPKDIDGAEYASAVGSTVVGALPTGVTYDGVSTMLSYDGTGTAGDRKLVTLTVGTTTRQFYVRVVVPNVIWGDRDQWDALPAVYQEGGAQEALVRIAAYFPTPIPSSSFAYACFNHMDDGDAPETAGSILVTRGTYDHVNEQAANAGTSEPSDIEWYTDYNCEHVLLLGEPTRGHRPFFTRSDGINPKFALGGHDTSAYNAHIKNLRSELTYMSIQPEPGLVDTVEHTWSVRKCDWSQRQGDVLGRWLDPVDDSSLATRTGEVAERAWPWNYHVDLNTFDRCGSYATSGGVGLAAVYMGGGFFATLHVNGCAFYGSYSGRGTAIYPETCNAKVYNTYASYLADPDDVASGSRMRLFLNIRASSRLDMWNCEMLIGQHAGESGGQYVPRGFVRTDSGSWGKRYPPLYPDVTAQAAPFDPVVIRMSSSNVSTAGGVPQLSYEGGSWADAGSAVLVSGSTWDITLDSTDFASDGRYRLRMRNAGSTTFTTATQYILLWSYQNVGYWYMAGNRIQDMTNADYPDAELSPRAYVPDDGATFWSSMDRESGEELKTIKRYIAHCRVTWDTRANGAAAATAAYAVVVDEGSYPVSYALDQYGTVPATWTDPAVTWLANNRFENFGVGIVPWRAEQPSLSGMTAHGAGVLPATIPIPLQVDYAASNVTGDNPAAATQDLPDFWGTF